MTALVLAIAATIGLLVFALALMHERLSRKAGDSPHQELSARINDALPGIHCGQCGYPGCEPYAKALAEGSAGIDKCPPGGQDLVIELARILGQEPDAGAVAAPDVNSSIAHKLARVRIRDCIGCTLCIDACPVDAIVGAPGHLHAVIADRCTGCELCVPPCPTDCIEMYQPEPRVREWEWPWVRDDRPPPIPSDR